MIWQYFRDSEVILFAQMREAMIAAGSLISNTAEGIQKVNMIFLSLLAISTLDNVFFIRQEKVIMPSFGMDPCLIMNHSRNLVAPSRLWGDLLAKWDMGWGYRRTLHTTLSCLLLYCSSGSQASWMILRPNGKQIMMGIVPWASMLSIVTSPQGTLHRSQPYKLFCFFPKYFRFIDKTECASSDDQSEHEKQIEAAGGQLDLENFLGGSLGLFIQRVQKSYQV